MGEFLFVAIALGPIFISLIARIAGYRLKQTYLLVTMLVLTSFSALRFESGQDWGAYENFFKQIDLQRGIFDYLNYRSYSVSQFEVGFYLLNYAIRIINGNYYHVLAVCSIVSGISVYIFFKQIKEYTDFAIVSYIGYSYLLLGFAQSRQSLGLAFFLFGLTFYLRRNKSILYFFAISLIGVAFQYSVAIYLLIGLTAYLITRFVWVGRIAIIIFLLLAIFIKNSNTNIFQFFMIIAFNETIIDKVNIYETDLSQGGILNLLYSVILLFNAFLIYRKSIYEVEFRIQFLFNLAATALYLSFLIVFVLPGFYALYSRVYALASILMPVVFYFIGRRKNDLTLHFFTAINYAALIISYFKIFYLFYDEYIPYNVWV